MKLNIKEVRKQPEGLYFEQTLDLSADLRKRNQEIIDVKDIVAVGKVQYEDRMFFLDYQLSYTIVLASSRSMEPVELAESYPVTEVFMEGATNQLDQEVLDDDLVLPIENGEISYPLSREPDTSDDCKQRFQLYWILKQVALLLLWLVPLL